MRCSVFWLLENQACFCLHGLCDLELATEPNNLRENLMAHIFPSRAEYNSSASTEMNRALLNLHFKISDLFLVLIFRVWQANLPNFFKLNFGDSLNKNGDFKHFPRTKQNTLLYSPWTILKTNISIVL